MAKINLTAIFPFLSRKGSQADLVAKQEMLDAHVAMLPRYISSNDPAQILRFLELYAQKGDDIRLKTSLKSVLDELKKAGYDGSVTEYVPNDPVSVARFSVSSLIRDMKLTMDPPSPIAAAIKRDLYFKALELHA